MKAEDFIRVKKRIDKLKSEHDKAVGAKEALIKQLKEEYDCETIEEAKKELEEIEADKQDAQEEYDKKLLQFQKKWSEVLQDAK